MLYLLALAIVILLGYLLVRLFIKQKISPALSLFLGTALGLGVISQMVFYVQLLANCFYHLALPLTAILLAVLLWWLNHIPLRMPRISLPLKPSQRVISLLLLSLLLIPLWLEANFFSIGGWDAWSCWNLKAKFIYLGQENWKDMFTPILWRSNTQYPLALPSINVWFWQWTGLSQSVPMYNSIVLTFLTAAILMLGLQELKVSSWVSLILCLSVFSLGHGNTLCISQYSDILFSLYLLCVFVCFLLFQKSKDQGFLILTALFMGLLSFTKNEGLAACAVLALLMSLQSLTDARKAVLALLLASIPTLIFTFFMAPHNEAFINGFASLAKPTSWERLAFILAYAGMELIHLKWNGLWIIALISLCFGHKHSFKQPLNIIGLFLAGYLAIVVFYYQLNTFFEIGWWMGTTLNRILFSLMPCVFLWIGLSLFQDPLDNTTKK